jgi:hypothetical protein
VNLSLWTKSLRFSAPRSAWIDCAVIAGLLITANLLLAPGDFGWLLLNPSPFLVLPVLIGCRYGFVAGVIAGALADLIIVTGLSGIGSVPVEDAIRQHGYALGVLVVLGGVCGEIQHAFRQRELQITTLHEHSAARLKKLDHDLYLLREAKADLERLLATRDSEVSTLDAELRRLFDCEGNDLYHGILLLLSRQARVSDAAIYRWKSETILQRRASIGSTQDLPEELDPQEIEMVATALKHKTAATVPEFWQSGGGASKKYLAAVPLMDSQDTTLGALLITGMPFIALNKKAVQLISLICRWAARVIEVRHCPRDTYRAAAGQENQKIFSPAFFQRNLELALKSYQLHGLPSSIVHFFLPGLPKSEQARLESAVVANLRGVDFPAQLELPGPNLAVLLPLTGERGAHIFLERIRLNCRRIPNLEQQIAARSITFDSRHTPEKLWQELHAPVETDSVAS